VGLSYTARRTLALGGVLLAMGFTLPRFLTHTPYPRLGVRLDWNTPSENPRVSSIVGPPGRGLLSRDDVILAVEGVPLTAKAVFAQNKGKPVEIFPRGPVQLSVQRHGAVVSVTVPPLALSPWQRVRLYALPLVTVIAVPLVAILLVWRRPDLSAAWVFLLFGVLEAVYTVWQIFRFPQGDMSGALATYLDLYHAVVLWLPASFLHFMLVFPRPRWEGRRPVTSPWLWLIVAAYLTPFALIAAGHFLHIPVDPMALWFQAIVFPLGSLALIDRYVRRRGGGPPPSTRERVLAVTVAVILCIASIVDLLPDEPRMMALLSLPYLQVFMTALFFAWLCTPFLIAYLIANDPAFDPRRLVVRSLPYALLSGLLAAIYLGIVLFGQRWFAVATGEETMVFNLIAALILAFAFAPLRERMQRGIDGLYGRDPMALRLALEQSGRELLGALDAHEVQASVERAIERGLRRPVAIDWPEGMGAPRLAEDVRDEERGPVETLLAQAAIRLENLTLQRARAAAERRAAELTASAMRAELRALQAQVQPHFLFNALNALSYLAETDPRAAQRFTERLADMLRYTVEASDRPVALLHEEIAFVEDYLGVARERYENPLRFEYRGPQELLSTGVPPLLLQPLVENSLKHGCASDGRPLSLSLEASISSEWLTLRFVDDGVPNGHNGRGLGVGLENLEQRLRHFGGIDAAVSAGRAEPQGFAVTMRWRLERLHPTG